MKLIIETCLESYLVALIENNQVVKHIFKQKLQKKSDALANDVKKLIDQDLKKLTGIYVTDGPGSFMGLRAGLIFGYTLALSLKIPFYTTSSLNFVSNNKKGTYYIDAKSKQSFSKTYPEGEVKLTSFKPNSLFDLAYFLKNPEVYLAMFKKREKLVAHYFKEPKVG